jgi:hypothetical protein
LDDPRVAASQFVHGRVVNDQGPVAGARIRFKGRVANRVTDPDGRFRIRRDPAARRLTAAKPGYLITGLDLESGTSLFQLKRLPQEDCEAYPWTDPTPAAARKGNCGNCHGEIYREWLTSGHARSVTGRHFQNLYDGSDQDGNPGRGWNLLAEHPDGAGVCTACHAPSLTSFTDPAYHDLGRAQGVTRSGVHCDYCHKVAEVDNAQIGLTHGRFGLRLRRPSEGQLFFGPLDDVDRGEDAYSPVYRESLYCASCHEGTVFGIPVYTTYSEWLESAARREGKECQSCHMTPTGRMTNLAPGRGGIERDPATLANHRFFDRSLEAMLRGSVRLEVRLTHEGEDAKTVVELRTHDVGHRVPTGFVDRHLLLVVEANAANGDRLEVRSGPRLPARAGRGWAGLPGRVYGKQLRSPDGGELVPFWRADTELVDTRLYPDSLERVEFIWDGRPARVQVRVLYRRFWHEVAETKRWPDNEICVWNRTVEAAPNSSLR